VLGETPLVLLFRREVDRELCIRSLEPSVHIAVAHGFISLHIHVYVWFLECGISVCRACAGTRGTLL
jgi:hypothetical protein